MLWYLKSCLWHTNTEIFDEKSGQFQAEFVATEPENLWWHVVKFKANTYSHLCLYVWGVRTFRMTLFVIRKGIFLTRSQDICRFVMANENMISVTRRQNIYSRVCGINRIYLTGSRDTHRFICWDKTRFLKPLKSNQVVVETNHCKQSCICGSQ